MQRTISRTICKLRPDASRSAPAGYPGTKSSIFVEVATVNPSVVRMENCAAFCHSVPLSRSSFAHQSHSGSRSVLRRPFPEPRSAHRPRRAAQCCHDRGADTDNTRRGFLKSLASAALAAAAGANGIAPSLATAPVTTPPVGYASPSGLKYFDFVVGEGPKPKWGDFLTVKLALYTVTPNGDALVTGDSMFNTKRVAIVHHGNGEYILGLEEALHSMKAGGRRRIIVPPQLGYIVSGMAPVPPAHWARMKFLNNVNETGGVVVMDVELVSIEKQTDDPFGYYSDLTPSPEELSDIFTRAHQKGVERDRAAGLL